MHRAGHLLGAGHEERELGGELYGRGGRHGDAGSALDPVRLDPTRCDRRSGPRPYANGWYNHGLTISWTSSDPVLRDRVVQLDDLRGTGQRRSQPHRHLHRRSRQHFGSCALLVPLRLDSADRRRGRGGTASGSRRLVQPPVLGQLVRLRRAFGDRVLHDRDLRRPDQRGHGAVGQLHRPGRQHQRLGRLRLQVRLDAAHARRAQPHAARRRRHSSLAGFRRQRLRRHPQARARHRRLERRLQRPGSTFADRRVDNYTRTRTSSRPRTPPATSCPQRRRDADADALRTAAGGACQSGQRSALRWRPA